jgi:hypothetical protein
VSDDNLGQSLELVGLKSRSTVHVMFRLESGEWPTER